MKVTLKFLSEKIGVNISTISRTLNNEPGVSTELRKKIIEYAKKYNYQTKKRKSYNILYLIDNKYFSSTSHFYDRVIRGIEEESKKNNLFFIFNTLDEGVDSINKTKIKFNIATGIILTGVYNEKLISELLGLKIPIILVDYYLPTLKIDSILIDNVDGIMTGIKYLVSKGHKRIAYLTGDTTSDIGSYDRLFGYKKALDFFDIEKDDDLLIKCGFTMSSAYEATLNFLKRSNNPPSAIIGNNDIITIGIMNAINDFGLKVPKDISIIGFDDIPLANEVNPKLTTLHIKKKTMGRMVVTRLLEIINNERIDHNKITIRPELIIRDSA